MMKKRASRVGPAPNLPHATPTLALRYASNAPCKVIAIAVRDAKFMLCLSLLWPLPGRRTHLLGSAPILRVRTDLDIDDRRRSRSPFLRQQFSCVRHGVPVPILPMSRELREELEPQEKASTRRLDTAVRAAQALRRAADIVVLTACLRYDTCVTVRRHAGGSNV